ncbi:MAG: cytochrome c [Spirosomataceae bacterium]
MITFKIKIKSVFICAAVSISISIAGLICVPLFANAQTAEQNYTMYCGACHGTKITESKLNSLVKTEWKQGSDKTSIIKSISEGIPNTQMIAWKNVLSAKEIEELAEFILKAQPQKKKKR